MSRDTVDSLQVRIEHELNLYQLYEERDIVLGKIERHKIRNRRYDDLSDETLESLEDELHAIEDSIIRTERWLFYSTLMEMDYDDHVRFFGDFHQYNFTGAFLLHGLTGRGLDETCIVKIQLKRLLSPLFKREKTIYVKHDCSIFYKNGDVEHLWQMLAHEIGLKIHEVKEDIIKSTCEKLETRNVVFLIENIEEKKPEEIATILKEFWKDLVTGVHKEYLTKTGIYHHTRLFLFLIDYTGAMTSENIHCNTADFDQRVRPGMGHENPEVPIRLPNVSQFTSEHLSEWINHSLKGSLIRNLLPEELIHGPRNIIIQDILQNSGGDPYRTMKYICTLRGDLFVEGVKACLTPELR